MDLNREKKFEVFAIVDRNIRPAPVRLAAQLMDPDAYVISMAMLKTHNAVVATGSVKNMVMGAPLHSLAGETDVFADKHLMHAMPLGKEKIGVNDCHHAMNYNMAMTALHMKRNWGVAVIDGSTAWKAMDRSTVRSSPCTWRWRGRTSWPWTA